MTHISLLGTITGYFETFVYYVDSGTLSSAHRMQ